MWGGKSGSPVAVTGTEAMVAGVTVSVMVREWRRVKVMVVAMVVVKQLMVVAVMLVAVVMAKVVVMVGAMVRMVVVMVTVVVVALWGREPRPWPAPLSPPTTWAVP